MSRPIDLYWNINNDSIDQAIAKFSELQKKVEELNAKAQGVKDSFTGIDEDQAKALDLEYKRLKIKEQEITIEEKSLKLAQRKQKIEEEQAKKMEAAVEKKAKEEAKALEKEEKIRSKILEKEEKESQKRIKAAEKQAEKERAAQEKLHAKAEAEREKERKHAEKMLALREKASGSKSGGLMKASGGRGFGGGSGPEIEDADFELINKNVKKSEGSLLKMVGGAGALGGALSVAASAAAKIGEAIIGSYTAIISAAAETQKLETNLALAFQSASVGGKSYEENLKLAESAMTRLNELAAQTPFSVNELTDSYIKLTKRGMRPAEDQLLALGNLASFSGKSIDQLVEAILDAQQGSKERLKEFGIDMQVEAGKTKLAIGDISVEGEKIIETFSKLGQMPGISDAMLRQSMTLEGVFNTLKDTFNQFLSDVGKSPDFLEPLQDAGGGLTVMMEGLKLSASAFGQALGEPLKIIVNSLFPKFEGSTKTIGNQVERFAKFFMIIAENIKDFLVPISEFFASIWDKINRKLTESSHVFNHIQKSLNTTKLIFQKVFELLGSIINLLIEIVTNIITVVESSKTLNNVINGVVATFFTIVDVLKEIIKMFGNLGDYFKGFGTLLKDFFAGGDFFNPEKWKNFGKELRKIKIFDTFSNENILKMYKKNLEQITKIPDPKVPERKKGELPGGADLAPVAGSKGGENKKQLKKEKEHLSKIETEKRRHVETVIKIEEEARKNREFNQTKARKLAEEMLVHEEKTFEEQKKFAQEEYEMQRNLILANIKNGEQKLEDLEYLDKKYKHEQEKREFEHGNKILELTQKVNETRIEEQLAFVKFSRKIEENRLEDNLNDLKRSIDRERVLIEKNAEKSYAHQEATNLKLLELDKKYAVAEYETQKQILKDKLYDNSLYNNLTIEEELDIKRQLENLEKKHQHTLLEIEDRGAKSRLQIQKDIAQKRKEISKSLIESIENSAKMGLGNNFGGAVMNIATIKTNVKDITEEARKEIAKFRSIATREANAIADMLEKKLKVDTLKTITSQVGEAVNNLVSGLQEMANKIQELRIAKIDEQIKKNNEEIEQLRQKAELEKERNEELLRRQEIDNKLAQQRIEELTQLQTSIPESEKALAQEQIEIQKKRIRDIEKAKQEADSQEKSRIKQIESENKRLEEEKQKVMREQFEINRAAQIAQAIIQGAVAAINAFSSLAIIPVVGPGLAAAAAATVGAFTAANVALIAAQPNPYKEGTLFVEGGIKNKDSVPALLTPGEAVIPVKENQDYHEVVKAIYNREIPPADMKMLIKTYKMKKLDMSNLDNNSRIIVNQIDSNSIVKAIKEKPVANVNIDEDGLEVFIEKAGEKTKILNKKLRIRK
jgi:hypothetical protein